MRHLKHGKKFGRTRGERKAFLAGLAANLVRRERITTTEVRAKAVRSLVERLVTHGKKQSVASLREIMITLPKKDALKLYHVIAPRYQDRRGGYTRVTKLAFRRAGDGARRAVIEFV